MSYDLTQILKIETWVRRLSWISALGLVLGGLALVVNLYYVFFWPDAISWDYDYPRNWSNAFFAFNHVRSYVLMGFTFLMLRGLSKIIRWLVAFRKSLKPLPVAKNPALD